jgi:flavodoxin
MLKILLLVSTVTGTAEMLAEDLRHCAADHDIELVLAERTDVARLAAAEHLVVVSSTYGCGEVPDPAKPLFAALENDGGSLSHVCYGVVSLGDLSLYEATFANGGRLWDALLEKKGARRMCATLILDCSSGENLSELATGWFRLWLETVAGTVV